MLKLLSVLMAWNHVPRVIRGLSPRPRHHGEANRRLDHVVPGVHAVESGFQISSALQNDRLPSLLPMDVIQCFSHAVREAFWEQSWLTYLVLLISIHTAHDRLKFSISHLQELDASDVYKI